MLLCIENYSFWRTEILFEKQRKERRGCGVCGLTHREDREDRSGKRQTCSDA